MSKIFLLGNAEILGELYKEATSYKSKDNTTTEELDSKE